ncbi:MAG: biotin-dependent carboxyltransferase family protein [Burkholderiaceae bacterium]|nr:biotin-dependent carboxyltransferase family protein [Burkholderiaceae bacterium]
MPWGAGHGEQHQAARPFVHATGPMRALSGPQDAHFDDEAWRLLVGGDCRVAREADRMGLRLQGPTLKHRAGMGA